MVRNRMKDKAGTSVINVKINEANEIELVEVDDVPESDLEDEEENEIPDQEEDDPELVPNNDGTMSIKLTDKKNTKTIVEHVCGKCAKTYSTFSALKRHLNLCRNLPKNEIVSDANDFSNIDINDPEYETFCFCCNEDKTTAHYGHIKCGFCPKSFKSHISLARHLYTLHSSSKDYSCDSCNATCPNQDILNIHTESHDIGKPFSCQNCGKDFTRKYHLDRHLKYTDCDKSMPKSEIPCHVCGKIFTRTDNLREHLRAHIGQSTRKKDYQCPHCEKSFYGSSLLNIHIRTHTGEKPFPCDLCDKSFPSNGALRKHRRMHTGEKPYACKTCGKCFSAKETLNRHNKIHTGERPHVCHVCDKSFIQATQLRSHMFHHTGENGFRCNQCDLAFNRKSRLNAHIKSMHNNIKDEQPLFECPTCQKVFPTEKKLEKHIEGHTTSKSEFICDICSKSFSSKQALQFHLRTHMKEQPCICEVCNKTFIRKDCLHRHMKQQHNRDDVIDEVDPVVPIRQTRKQKVDNCVALEEAPLNKKGRADTAIVAIDEHGDIVEFEINETIDDLPSIKADPVKTEKLPADIKPIEGITMDEDMPIFMDDEMLKTSIAELLNLVVDEETLRKFGWPDATIEHVLSAVIEQCGQAPADYNSCSNYTTKMRENVKLLFTTVIDNESIKSMLNNNTIDEVIMHVLKLAKS